MAHFDIKNLLAVDIETTGVSPYRNDVLAIGLVPVDPLLPVKQIFVRHDRLEWNEFAQQNFERFQARWLSDAVTPKIACQSIEDYIRETFSGEEVTLVGHNIGFDVAFLRKLAYQAGRDQLAGVSHRMVDTHTLLFLLTTMGRIPPNARTSDGALEYFSIHIAPECRHTALEDARATRDVFVAAMRELLVLR